MFTKSGPCPHSPLLAAARTGSSQESGLGSRKWRNSTLDIFFSFLLALVSLKHIQFCCLTSAFGGRLSRTAEENANRLVDQRYYTGEVFSSRQTLSTAQHIPFAGSQAAPLPICHGLYICMSYSFPEIPF